MACRRKVTRAGRPVEMKCASHAFNSIDAIIADLAASMSTSPCLLIQQVLTLQTLSFKENFLQPQAFSVDCPATSRKVGASFPVLHDDKFSRDKTCKLPQPDTEI